ncbi:MAG: MBL fold metallo-hydrolase [Polymorphobacter sp.]
MKALLLTLALLLVPLASAGGEGAGTTPKFTPWNAGLTAAEPPFQVQRLDPDTYVIRQSVRTNFEAPFLYLLVGTTRALLLDSGAGNASLRPVIDAIMAERRAELGTPDLPLTVAHSHSHSDHHQGDAELAARPGTTVIGLTPTAVAAAFHIKHWPGDIGHIELGNRRLAIIPTPGHEPAHIMVHDPQTAALLTGDSLYPGRLYVPIDQFGTYRASIDRAVRYVKTRKIRVLLGAHIEMRRTAGEDYAQQASSHPDEHPLELAPAALGELQVALHKVTGEPVRDTHKDFIIVPRWPR